MYIYQQNDWPNFRWDGERLAAKLSELRYRQGKLLGRMQGLGFPLRSEALLETLTFDVLKTSEIEGEMLNGDQVRSSIARRLGIDIFGLVPADRNVEGIVDMLLDAIQLFRQPLTQERLFGWHAALFPTGRSGIRKITVADWRQPEGGPMQVVSGPMGKETIHFQAPDAVVVAVEMQRFIEWFNGESELDAVIKAAIAHFWFVTIHPFEDGNGRIARTIADMQLTRADGSPQRFYSMSAQIHRERNRYYAILEETQKGDLDITGWLNWFLDCLDRALTATDDVLAGVLKKARYWDWLNTKSLNERQRRLLNKLLDGFEGKLTSSKWAKIARCSQDTALRDMQNLMEQGVLVREASGGRSTAYLLAHPPEKQDE